MNQNQLFEFIRNNSFMIDEIGLFLNTHPECKEALHAYDEFKKLRKKAIEEYTEMYGPISKYNVNADNYWTWVNSPWPWQKECGC